VLTSLPMPAPSALPLSIRAGLQRIWPWTADVDRASLRADLGAAPLAMLLALPQGIAFAALAGLPPAWGLYAAIVPGFVAAIAGSSRHLVTGPTNALAVALAASLAPLAIAGSPEYLGLALVVTLLVGLVQLCVALLRLGTLAHFISPAVLLGFTAGAAVLIAWHALRSWLALPQGWPFVDDPLPPWAPGEWAIGLVALATVMVLRRFPRTARSGLPWLLALVAGLLLGLGLRLLPGENVAIVGALPAPWPVFAVPPLAWDDLPRVGGIALALTLIALGQTMAIAKTLAARSGQSLDTNRECLGQGLANTAGAFFSSFVVCGSFNRSIPHQMAGARTPLAAAFAALGLLAVVVVAAPLLALIPMAAVNGLLLLIAASLVDVPAWRSLWRIDRREAAVAGGTFAAMLLLSMAVAILSGVAASLLVYLYRSATPAMRPVGFAEPPQPGRARSFVVLPPEATRCPQLTMLRMEGNVFFGAVPHVAEHLQALRDGPQPPKHLLVMVKSMNFVDAAGVALWEDERRRRAAMGGGLYFHRPRPPVMQAWGASGFVERLGAEHLFPDKQSAIAAIVPRLDGEICARCTARVYAECARQPGGDPGPAAAGEGGAADASLAADRAAGGGSPGAV
jgi:sulfate permease, SulP family